MYNDGYACPWIDAVMELKKPIILLQVIHKAANVTTQQTYYRREVPRPSFLNSHISMLPDVRR